MSSDARGTMASSPQSSDHATAEGTPSTNITALSPEAAASSGKKGKGKGKAPLTVSVTHHSGPADTHDGDVFLAPAPTSGGMRALLSPTADIFTPGLPDTATLPQGFSAIAGPSTLPFGYSDTTEASTPRLYDGSSHATLPTRAVGAGRLVPNSFPDYNPSSGTPSTGRSHAAGTIGQPLVPPDNDLVRLMHNLQVTPFRDVVVRDGVFSNDVHETRSFVITNSRTPMDLAMVTHILQTGNYSVDGVDTAKLMSERIIVASFNDVREAKQAFFAIRTHLPVTMSMMSYTGQELAAYRQDVSDPLCYLFEGQVMVYAYFKEDAYPPVGADSTVTLLKQFLAGFGEVRAMHSLPIRQRNVREFIVEFYNVQASVAIINFTQGSHRLEDIAVEVTPWTESDVNALNGPVPAEQISVTGRSMVPAGHPDYESIIGNLRGYGHRKGLKTQYCIIDIESIRFGHDVRTTIMLRNIPNRVTQAELKREIDRVSFGDYDFMYLRIDFANNCNVGYAFINFIEPSAIIPFAQAYQSQQWSTFNSSKVAAISYATIQGRENLIQKFRNSSVMLEHPSFRPKLFYTKPHPLAGSEEPFPAPDNLQKMRRSVENAETVGLYPTRCYNPNELPLPQASRARMPPTPPHTRLTPERARAEGISLTFAGWQRLIKAPTSSTSARIASHPLLGIRTAPPGASFSPYSPPPTPSTPWVAPAVPRTAPAAPGRLVLDRSARITSSPSPNELVNTARYLNPFVVPGTSLFAPKQGQAFREEQRRRRSQFDRGTPGAELELQGMVGNSGPYAPSLGSPNTNRGAMRASYGHSGFGGV